jgi:hypothetical protein
LGARVDGHQTEDEDQTAKQKSNSFHHVAQQD